MIFNHYWMANVSGLKGKCQRSFLQISKANIDLSYFLESILKHKQVWKTWKDVCISMILIIAKWKVFEEKWIKILLWQNITICKGGSTSKIWCRKCQNNLQVRHILIHTSFTETFPILFRINFTWRVREKYRKIVPSFTLNYR